MKRGLTIVGPPGPELVPLQGGATERRSGITPLPAMQVPDPPLIELSFTEDEVLRLLHGLRLANSLGRASAGDFLLRQKLKAGQCHFAATAFRGDAA